MIVLHGGPGLDSQLAFRPYLDPLGDEFRLLYVDERGQGRSERVDPTTLSLDVFARDVDLLAEALELERFALLGHSFGAIITTKHAIEIGTAAAYVISGGGDSSAALEADVDASLEAMGEAGEPIKASWEQEKTVATEDELRELLRVQMPFHFAGDVPPGSATRRSGRLTCSGTSRTSATATSTTCPTSTASPSRRSSSSASTTARPRRGPPAALHEGIAGSQPRRPPRSRPHELRRGARAVHRRRADLSPGGRRLMWRLRLFFERVGWKPFAIGAGIVVLVAVAAGAAIALLGGGDESSAPTTTAVQERTNVYYLRAVAPETHVQGCSMRIRFIWKPDYHAIQYLGANAIITVSGTDIAGSYRQKFTRKGLALDVGPVDLRGGYKVWSAKVTAMDGDPPGNDTTVQTAPPTNSNCT